jgi:hypothetical protein
MVIKGFQHELLRCFPPLRHYRALPFSLKEALWGGILDKGGCFLPN